jgi:hypothetical protein
MEMIMGYRSDIYLRMSPEATEVFSAIAKLEPNVQSMLDSACSRIEKDDGTIDLFFGERKWYDNYREVSEFDAALYLLDDDDYGFIRIGDDSDDVEYRGDTCGRDMYVQRSVEW